jgi:hypothetical protein
MLSRNAARAGPPFPRGAGSSVPGCAPALQEAARSYGVLHTFMQLAGTRAAAASSVPDRELPGPAPRLSGGDLGGEAIDRRQRSGKLGVQAMAGSQPTGVEVAHPDGTVVIHTRTFTGDDTAGRRRPRRPSIRLRPHPVPPSPAHHSSVPCNHLLGLAGQGAGIGVESRMVRAPATVGCILGSGSRPDATRITAVGIAGNCRPQSQSRRLKSRYRPPDRIRISAVEVNTPRGLPNPG